MKSAGLSYLTFKKFRIVETHRNRPRIVVCRSVGTVPGVFWFGLVQAQIQPEIEDFRPDPSILSGPHRSSAPRSVRCWKWPRSRAGRAPSDPGLWGLGSRPYQQATLSNDFPFCSWPTSPWGSRGRVLSDIVLGNRRCLADSGPDPGSNLLLISILAAQLGEVAPLTGRAELRGPGSGRGPGCGSGLVPWQRATLSPGEGWGRGERSKTLGLRSN